MNLYHIFVLVLLCRTEQGLLWFSTAIFFVVRGKFENFLRINFVISMGKLIVKIIAIMWFFMQIPVDSYFILQKLLN